MTMKCLLLHTGQPALAGTRSPELESSVRAKFHCS